MKVIIKVLDIKSFKTMKVANMESMFSNFTSLETIYIGSSWNVTKVTTSTNMFLNDTKLKGATSYTSSCIDVKCASKAKYLTM